MTLEEMPTVMQEPQLAAVVQPISTEEFRLAVDTMTREGLKLVVMLNGSIYGYYERGQFVSKDSELWTIDEKTGYVYRYNELQFLISGMSLFNVNTGRVVASLSLVKRDIFVCNYGLSELLIIGNTTDVNYDDGYISSNVCGLQDETERAENDRLRKAAIDEYAKFRERSRKRQSSRNADDIKRTIADVLTPVPDMLSPIQPDPAEAAMTISEKRMTEDISSILRESNITVEGAVVPDVVDCPTPTSTPPPPPPTPSSSPSTPMTPNTLAAVLSLAEPLMLTTEEEEAQMANVLAHQERELAKLFKDKNQIVPVVGGEAAAVEEYEPMPKNGDTSMIANVSYKPSAIVATNKRAATDVVAENATEQPAKKRKTEKPAVADKPRKTAAPKKPKNEEVAAAKKEATTVTKPSSKKQQQPKKSSTPDGKLEEKVAARPPKQPSGNNKSGAKSSKSVASGGKSTTPPPPPVMSKAEAPTEFDRSMTAAAAAAAAAAAKSASKKSSAKKKTKKSGDDAAAIVEEEKEQQQPPALSEKSKSRKRAAAKIPRDSVKPKTPSKSKPFGDPVVLKSRATKQPTNVDSDSDSDSDSEFVPRPKKIAKSSKSAKSASSVALSLVASTDQQMPISRSHASIAHEIAKEATADDPSHMSNASMSVPEPLPPRTPNPKRTSFTVKSIVRPANVTSGSGRPPRHVTKVSIGRVSSNNLHAPFQIKPKVRVVTYPEYSFYEGEYEPDPYADITMDSCINCFPKSLDLVPLRSIANDHPRTLADVRMNHTASGEYLRELTWRRSDCAYTKTIMNDTRTYPLVYYLVYGAVPLKMADASTYFMKQLVRSYVSYGEDRDTCVPMISGEIEIMTYIYWDLSCDDLRYWRDDVPRKPLKRLLAYAWSVLPRENLTPDQASIRQKILDYAQFDLHDQISAQCVLYIKYRYEAIVRMLDKKDIPIWHYFMKSCRVHHYACPHTLREIFSNMSVVADMLRAKFEKSKFENSNICAKLISRTEAAKLFMQKWLKTDSHMSAELYESTNNLIGWTIHRVVSSLVGLGLHIDLHEITDRTIAGIARTFKDLTCNDVFVSRTFSDTVIRNIVGLFVKTIHTQTDSIVKVRISEAGKNTLIELIYAMISRSISAVIFTDVPEPKWGVVLAEAMRDYMEEVSTGVDMGAWYIGNADSDVEMSDLTSESDEEEFAYDSDESVCENESNGSADKLDIREARDKRLDGAEEKFAAYVSPIPNLPIKQARRMLCKDACANGKYQFDPVKISRTKCTMCWVETTVNMLCLSDSLKVATCNFCARTLNDTDYDLSALKKRIDKRVKAPLMFAIGADNKRELLSEGMISTGLTQLSYNYIVRRQQLEEYKRRRAEKLSSSSSSSTAKPKKAKTAKLVVESGSDGESGGDD